MKEGGESGKGDPVGAASLSSDMNEDDCSVISPSYHFPFNKTSSTIPLFF